MFVWLIPVSNEECGFIGTHGWQWFEDRLVEQRPNLFDLMRPDVRRPTDAPAKQANSKRNWHLRGE